MPARARDLSRFSDKKDMTEGQIFLAKDEYELYGTLRGQISVHDFVEGQIVCLRFLRSSTGSFVLDKAFESEDIEKIWKFQEELNHQGFYCILNSLEDVEKVTLGCDDFVVVMKVTETYSWIDLFEFTGRDARYEQHVFKQAAQSFEFIKKMLAD